MEDRTEIVNGLIVTDAARTINAWNSLCDEEKERKRLKDESEGMAAFGAWRK